jgi:ferredoxin
MNVSGSVPLDLRDKVRLASANCPERAILVEKASL